MKRLCIYPKDVVKITGKGLRRAQNLLQLIRAANQKKKHHCVTLEEFCSYMDIDPDNIDLD